MPTALPMAPNRWVVLDDTDIAVKYTGSWLLDTSSRDKIGNFGPPYLHTLHGTSTNGTVSVEFNGTAVQVFGSNIDQNTTNPDPDFKCFIDDVSIDRTSPFQFAENNWELCNKNGLLDGLHRLRIDVTVISPDHTFWLDQIKYNPSLTVPLDNKVLWLSNTDSAISYDSSWEEWPGGLGNITSQTNSMALVKFIGTSITWMAFTPKERSHTGTVATWSIDGGGSNQFTLQGIPNGTDVNTAYNQVYFATPEFQQGPHTLTVTFLGSSQTTPLSLNSLFIKNGPFPNNSTRTLINPSPASSAQAQVSNTQSLAGSPKPPVGRIVGGILGGLSLLLFVLVVSFLCWRHRRMGQAKGAGDDPIHSNDPHLSPSDVTAQANQYHFHPPSGPLQAGHLVAPTQEQQPSGAHWRRQREALGEPQDSVSLLPAYVPAAGGVPPSRQQTAPYTEWVIEGQGEGSRVGLGQRRIEDAPPQYTPD